MPRNRRVSPKKQLVIYPSYNYIVVMDDLRLQWDDAKAESNIKKHGISFEEARTVFSDDFARVIPDPDSSYGEERFIIPGQSSAMKLSVVCHCY